MRILVFALVLAASAAAAQDITREQVVRPEGTRSFALPEADARREGQRLFNDTQLSTNGNSCASCHNDLQGYNETFRAPYPHFVQMARDTVGLESATAENMIQICMLIPMAAQPLPWGSRELAALNAYVEQVRREYAAR